MLTTVNEHLDGTQMAAIAASLVGEELPESKVHELLLSIVPERVSAEGFTAFVETVRYILADEYRGLAKLKDTAFDCCGTGGSGLQHFNTSTAVSFILGAAGFVTVKFGNTAATSASGSFDFLEELGFSIQVSATQSMELLDACSQVFLFAPQCYPALGRLAPARKSLQQRTIFNYIGPLLNPSRPSRRLLGVSDPTMQDHIAHYLATTAITQKALVVRSENNLDELDPDAANYVIHVEGSDQAVLSKELIQNCFDAEGTPATSDSAGESLSAKRNAEMFLAIIEGKDRTSRQAKLLQANGGAALYAAGKTTSLGEGYELARDLLADGAVKQQFEKVRTAYARLVS
jgi:anthranilate phosphoribosyltransferase